MKTGPTYKIPSKYTLKNEECEHCDSVRGRKTLTGDVLICAINPPKADADGRAQWPIVHPQDSCGKFVFNNG